jgi:hypothetical protein
MSDPTNVVPLPPASRREPARDERLEILRMVETGTISADEAAKLLDALDRADRAERVGADAVTQPLAAVGGRARHMRVRISDSTTGKANVNLTLPIGLLDAGLGIARRIAPKSVVDADAIRQSMAGGFRGSLIDVTEGGERIEIIVE